MTGADVPSEEVAERAGWVRFTPVQRAMARRMERTATVPIATEFTYVDVVRAMAEVRQLREEGVPATFNSLVVAAVARGLRAEPDVAAEVDYESWERHVPHSPGIGVAVAAERGLVVPVVRDAVRKTSSELSTELDGLVRAVRAGAIDAPLFAGGHFSITNIGNLPVYGGTPLPATPQIAILGVSTAWDAAVVVEGELAVSRLVRMTIAIDHRALDGITAARFLAVLKDTMEAPEGLRVV